MNKDKQIQIYENETQLYPQSFQSWWNYISYFHQEDTLKRTEVFQKALKQLPGSLTSPRAIY